MTAFMDVCPACGADLECRTLGHEVPPVYDGILFWSCLGCGRAWPRSFPGQPARQRHASDHADAYNAAEAGPWCVKHPDRPAAIDQYCEGCLASMDRRDDEAIAWDRGDE